MEGNDCIKGFIPCSQENLSYSVNLMDRYTDCDTKQDLFSSFSGRRDFAEKGKKYVTRSRRNISKLENVKPVLKYFTRWSKAQ